MRSIFIQSPHSVIALTINMLSFFKKPYYPEKGSHYFVKGENQWMLNDFVSVECSIHALLSLHELAKCAVKTTLKSDRIC